MKILRTPTRPTCHTDNNCDSDDLDLAVPRSLVRDILLGPKVLAELAILRRLAD